MLKKLLKISIENIQDFTKAQFGGNQNHNLVYLKVPTKTPDEIIEIFQINNFNLKNNIGNNEIKIGGKLKSKIAGKKQYIVSDEISKVKDCIVMPRVISKNMKFALIENNDSYLFENHVMVITHENKEMINELYEMMVGGHISFQDYFNSTNITVNEILNFEY